MRTRRLWGGVANTLQAPGERLERLSGRPCTIVHPGWFDMIGRGEERLILPHGDAGSGTVSRAQVAEVLVRSLLTSTAQDKTFELFATAGPAPTAWGDLFA